MATADDLQVVFKRELQSLDLSDDEKKEVERRYQEMRDLMDWLAGNFSKIPTLFQVQFNIRARLHLKRQGYEVTAPEEPAL
ncbi:MAG: hypothetical protein Q7R86_01625 [bacterium]|nr:hypothetical protein [bacterium]